VGVDGNPEIRRAGPATSANFPFPYNIEEELEGADKLEIKANKADLELYIDRQILKNKNLRKVVEKSPSIRQDVKSAVVVTAADM